MGTKGVQVVVWENLDQFFDEILRVHSPVVFIVDKNVDRCHKKNRIREDVLSLFDKDDRLFLIYGEEQGYYLARKETLPILLTRVAASMGHSVSSFRDCLAFAQTDSFTRGLMGAYNAEGPYSLWGEEEVRIEPDNIGMCFYINQEYGFSIEYPKSWHVKQECWEFAEDKIRGVTIKGKTLLECKRPYTVTGQTIGFNVAIEELPSNMRLEEYFALREEASRKYFSFPNAIQVEDNRDNVTIANRPAIQRIFTVKTLQSAQQTWFKFKECYILSGKMGYIITCQAPPDVFETVNRQYFERIVESFKINQK